MGFFPEVTRKASKSKAVDSHFAHRLFDILKKSKKLFGSSWSPLSWSDDFRILRGWLEGDTSRIEAALNWLEVRIKDEYCPRAYSAQSFRKKFVHLEDAMQRNPLPAQETKAGLDVLKEVLYFKMSWPKDSSSQLRQVIEESLVAHAAFYEGVKGYANRMKQTIKPGWTPSNQAAFAAEFERKFRHGPTFVTFEWMVEVNASIATWKNWNGKLSSFILSRVHPLFHRIGRRWAHRYCGQPEQFDIMMRIIDESN